MPHRNSSPRRLSLQISAALCLGVALCAAAPKTTPTKSAPAASTKGSAKPQASAVPTASASPSSAPSANPVTITLAPGKRGTWSGRQGNVAKPINTIGSVGNDIYATGDKTVFHSVNGGQEWLVQPVEFTGVAFWSFGPNDIWLGGAQLAHSTDQGKTWTVTSPFPKGVVVYSLWGLKPNEMYGVGGGGGGVIVYSKDGGKTFTKQSAGTKGGWLYQVAGNGGEVFVVGKEDSGEHSKGVLLVTKDHGKSWKRLPSPKATDDFQSITHLCFSDSGKMFITTSYEVYMTPNRGKTWESLLATGGAEILDFACRGKELYVAGRGRHFHHSTNQGATWTDSELAPVFTGKAMASVQAVHITANRDVFAGGEGEYTDHSGSLFRLNH